VDGLFGRFVAAVSVFYAVSFSVAYVGGRLVERGVRVNYTRKCNHFVTIGLPWVLQGVFGLRQSIWAVVGACILMPLHLALYLKPIRDRLPAAATMFRSFDRPEDRPNTLFWSATQQIAVFSVFPFVYALMLWRGIELWTGIAVAVNTFGDGLAEPVGVAFGRHPYEVAGFFSDKKYRRTWEGSAWIALVAAAAVAAYHESFTPTQFWTALAAVPPTAAATEALSPHTWDAPALFFVVIFELLLISCL
jgi:phytol kinase